MQPVIILPLSPAIDDGFLEGKNAKQPPTVNSFAEILGKKNGCIANSAKDRKKMVSPVKATNDISSLSGSEAVLSGPVLKVDPSSVKDAATTNGQVTASTMGDGSPCPLVSGVNGMGSAQLIGVDPSIEVAAAARVKQEQDSIMPIIWTKVPESSVESASAAQPVIPNIFSAGLTAIPVDPTPPATNAVNTADSENITSGGEALAVISATDRSVAAPEERNGNNRIVAFSVKDGADLTAIPADLPLSAGNGVNTADGENITSGGEALVKDSANATISEQQGQNGGPQKPRAIKQVADEDLLFGKGDENVDEEVTSGSVKVTASLTSTKEKSNTPALAEKWDDGGASTEDSFSNNFTGLKHDTSDVPLDFRLKLMQVKPVGEEQLQAKGNIDNVLKRLELMVKNGISTARMVLKPEHLGSLTVSLVSLDSGIVARFLVENHQAKSLLEGSMAAFRQQLEQNGVRVERLEVSLFNHTSGDGSLGNGSQFLGQGNERPAYHLRHLVAGYDAVGPLDEKLGAEMPRMEGKTSAYISREAVDYII